MKHGRRSEGAGAFGGFHKKSKPVFLLDRLSDIFQRQRDFTGKIVAKYVSDPLYDLILCNVPMARGVNDPNSRWNEHEEMNKTGEKETHTPMRGNEEAKCKTIAERVKLRF